MKIMKKRNANQDKSAPYRTNGLGKIDAPTKKEGEPRVTKTVSGGDMRGGKK